MMRRSGLRPTVKRWKLSCVMLRRAASGHIEATQLSKLAAASRIAPAVIRGWPEAPSSPLHGSGPLLAAGAAPGWGEAPGGGGGAGWAPLAGPPGRVLPRGARGAPPPA